jgi:hypothetical protein
MKHPNHPNHPNPTSEVPAGWARVSAELGMNRIDPWRMIRFRDRGSHEC